MIKLNNMKLPATVIICAYNEENTIKNILTEICELNIFDEIIVINDGSNDKTRKFILEQKKAIEIKDIHLLTNMGKGFAMTKGIEMSSNDYLVFIDADLSNFTITHALELLNPLLEGEADMILGQATKTLIHPEVNPFRTLSGQRAIRKVDILPVLEKMKTTGYGVETLINMQYSASNKIVKYVNLKNLIHPTKFQKTRPLKAIKEFIQEGRQIISTAFSNYILIKKANKKRASNILNTYN